MTAVHLPRLIELMKLGHGRSEIAAPLIDGPFALDDPGLASCRAER